MIQLNQRQVAGSAIVTVSGTVDLWSSPQLRRELLDVVKSQPQSVCVDLSGVEYMDTSGIATLIDISCKLNAEGKKLKVAAPSEDVLHVLELVGPGNDFEVYGSVDEACTGRGTAADNGETG